MLPAALPVSEGTIEGSHVRISSLLLPDSVPSLPQVIVLFMSAERSSRLGSLPALPSQAINMSVEYLGFQMANMYSSFFFFYVFI